MPRFDRGRRSSPRLEYAERLDHLVGERREVDLDSVHWKGARLEAADVEQVARHPIDRGRPADCPFDMLRSERADFPPEKIQVREQNVQRRSHVVHDIWTASTPRRCDRGAALIMV